MELGFRSVVYFPVLSGNREIDSQITETKKKVAAVVGLQLLKLLRKIQNLGTHACQNMVSWSSIRLTEVKRN